MTNENNKIKKLLISFLVVFVAVLVFYFGIMSINEINNKPAQPNTIDVAGKGEVYVKPDIAEISLSVHKEEISLAAVQKEATDAINKIISFLKNSGIDEKDIKTTNYNIYPRYDYLRTGQVFRGYDIDQSLDVKIRKIEDAGDILAGATNAGANQVGGISFTVDNMDAVERQAREAAIGDAKEKAQELAKDLGVRLGRLISFSESGISPIPVPLYEKSAAGVTSGAAPAPEIPAGENKITSNVTLTYEIK